jgi:hypothetical protein
LDLQEEIQVDIDKDNEIPNEETQLDDCLNPYSISKVAGEKLCSIYTNIFGLDTIIFRYFNVYGDKHPTKGIYAPVIGLFDVQKLNGEKLFFRNCSSCHEPNNNLVVGPGLAYSTKNHSKKKVPTVGALIATSSQMIYWLLCTNATK